MSSVGPFILSEGEVYCGQCGWFYVGGTDAEAQRAFIDHLQRHRRF